jgi:uroporphyrinogen-III decarboxylase
MKHRERVLAALSHQVPDRCPMQISFTPEFADRVRADRQLKDRALYNPHGGTNYYDLERVLDEDLLLTTVGWVNGYYQPGYQDVDAYTDEWCVTWKTVEYTTRFGKGKYTEPVGHPLTDDKAIDSYKPPSPYRPELYTEAARVIREFKHEYWVVGVVVNTIFECAWALRGFDRLMMDFLLNHDLAERILDIPYRYHSAAAQKLVEMGVDMVWLGDDVGAQEAMLMSPALWRKHLKPRIANLIGSLKKINSQVKVAYHSDGMIYPIIPDLIEIGLDVLNPIQPGALDPVKLKKEFGDKLCFWGSMDIQHTLPYGTTSEVQSEVLTRLNTLGKNGGLIIGPSHSVQLDVPMENFWTMVNTITKTPYHKEF